MAETSEFRSGEGNLFLQFLLPLMVSPHYNPFFQEYLIFQAGGVAGTTVDVVLFPLDTIKTRLQSKHGFWRAGGFHRIYAGILPAAAGSAPSGDILCGQHMIYLFHSCHIFLYLRVC